MFQGRARQLYNAGFKTVQCIAKVQPKDLQDKLPYLSKKVATQIIEAAKVTFLKDKPILIFHFYIFNFNFIFVKFYR